MTASIALPTLYEEALISFAHGKSPDTVLKDLVSQGLPEPHARVLMDEALRQKKKVFRQAGFQMMFKGAGMVVLGIIVTAFTFSLHLPVFIVATGPILFGVVNFFKGMARVITG